MKIISWNVNGLRAVYKRDFLGWLKKSGADIICLQEIKAGRADLPNEVLKPSGYSVFINSAEKKGYSGVMIYSKKKPEKIHYLLQKGSTFKKVEPYGEISERFNREGRLLRLDFKDLIVLNLYLPHGGREKENLPYKLEVYENLFKYLEDLKDKNIILIGDFNIAHTELDLARPKGNMNNIMFTPQEREMLDKLTDKGFVDTFRTFHKEGGHYTWWPYRFGARERNIGWRLDYVFVSKSLAPKVKDAFILPCDTGSDHCPVGVDLVINP